MAICASIAHNFFIRAYAVGEASVIAPIDYIRLLFSAAVDFLIFGIIFGLNTLIGSAIIILTSLYILRREAKVKKGKETKFRRNLINREIIMQLDENISAVITGGASGLGEATAREN